MPQERLEPLPLEETLKQFLLEEIKELEGSRSFFSRDRINKIDTRFKDLKDSEVFKMFDTVEKFLNEHHFELDSGYSQGYDGGGMWVQIEKMKS